MTINSVHALERLMPVLNLPSMHIDDGAATTLPDVVIAQLAGEEDPDNLSAIAAHWLVTRDFLYTLDNVRAGPC